MSHKLQTVLRETAELKRLNAGLMKSTAIDDLLGDTYAAIWTEIGPTFEPAKLTKPTTPTPSLPSTPAVLPWSPQQNDNKRSVMSLSNLMNLDGASDPHGSVPVTPALAPPIVIAPPTSIPEALPRPRARLISRREIVKRASDTVLSKSAASRALSPPSKAPSRPPGSSSVRVVIETRPSAAETSNPSIKNEDAVIEPGTSPPAESVQDDADDESELSELEEEEEEEQEEQEELAVGRPALFPNLKSGGLSSVTRSRTEAAEDDRVGQGVEQDDSDVLMQ